MYLLRDILFFSSLISVLFFFGCTSKESDEPLTHSGIDGCRVEVFDSGPMSAGEREHLFAHVWSAGCDQMESGGCKYMEAEAIYRKAGSDVSSAITASAQFVEYTESDEDRYRYEITLTEAGEYLYYFRFRVPGEEWVNCGVNGSVFPGQSGVVEEATITVVAKDETGGGDKPVDPVDPPKPDPEDP